MRWFAAVSSAALLTLAVLAAAPSTSDPAAAGEPATTITTTEGPSVDRDIIPRPDSGREPESPGDRGGWAQLLVLAVLLVGLAVLGLLAHRSSRRARSELTDRRP